MTQVPVPNPALLQEWEEALLQAARQAEEARRTGRPLGPATGFPAVDAEIGGYLAPGLHILLSAPGTGKTAMGLQIAGQCGCPCLYISSEQSPLELLWRIIARTTSTYLGRLKSGEIGEERLRPLIRQAFAQCPQVALYNAMAVDPTEKDMLDRFTHLQESGERLKERFTAEHLLVILDSLTDWVHSGSGGATEEYAATEAALTYLKMLSHNLSCPVLVIAHRNRAGQRGDESSKLHAGKGTGRMEYIGESLWNLERPKMEPDANGLTDVTLTLLKNRHGSSGKPIAFTFEGRLQQFKEGRR